MAKVAFTAKRVQAFKCPPDKKQVIYMDADCPGLGLRITPKGEPAFIFQGYQQRRCIRITIGSPDAWTIPDAQKAAREYQRLIDLGIDPREQRREQESERQAQRQQQEAQAVTFGEAWQQYMAARWDKWGEHHRNDHQRLTRAPGATKAGKPTIAGPLYEFWGSRLADLTPEAIQQWAESQAQDRPTVARLSWRLLRAFMSWCAEQSEYRELITDNPAKTKGTREALGSGNAKRDTLEDNQLAEWFAAVQGSASPTMAAYIQAMLLTGARPGELLALKWDDINTRWRSITLRDKDESKGGKDGTRAIPLTPYVWHLLANLPRRSQWVFASASTTDNGALLDAPISTPYKALRIANQIAGIEHVTFHGLRRSFSSLSEWLEIPAGVIAQIQGHKPSATAEKHYKVRPLRMLALHHERFEAWMLEQAGIVFDPQQQPGGLRLVASNEA